jgi:hypothetical protein
MRQRKESRETREDEAISSKNGLATLFKPAMTLWANFSSVFDTGFWKEDFSPLRAGEIAKAIRRTKLVKEKFRDKICIRGRKEKSR